MLWFYFYDKNAMNVLFFVFYPTHTHIPLIKDNKTTINNTKERQREIGYIYLKSALISDRFKNHYFSIIILLVRFYENAVFSGRGSDSWSNNLSLTKAQESLPFLILLQMYLNPLFWQNMGKKQSNQIIMLYSLSSTR